MNHNKQGQIILNTKHKNTEIYADLGVNDLIISRAQTTRSTIIVSKRAVV